MFKKYTETEIIKLFAEGRIHEFYNSRGWRNLAREVKREQNYECQLCKKRGKYSPSHTVHHIEELRTRPDLAYSRKNLIALCFDCHNKIHDNIKPKKPAHKRFTNEEIW